MNSLPQVQRTWASTYSGWIPCFIGVHVSGACRAGSSQTPASARHEPRRENQDRERREQVEHRDDARPHGLAADRRGELRIVRSLERLRPQARERRALDEAVEQRQRDHDDHEAELLREPLAVFGVEEVAERSEAVGGHVAPGRDQDHHRKAARVEEPPPELAEERDPLTVAERFARGADGEAEEHHAANPNGGRDQVERADCEVVGGEEHGRGGYSAGVQDTAATRC